MIGKQSHAARGAVLTGRALRWGLLAAACGLVACDPGEEPAQPAAQVLGFHAAALTGQPPDSPASAPLPDGTAMAPDEFHRRVLAILAAGGVGHVRELSASGRLAIDKEIAKTPAKPPGVVDPKVQGAYVQYLDDLAAPGATAKSLAAKKSSLFGEGP